MPRAQWPLCHHRPSIEVTLAVAHGGQAALKTLLADTGAGSRMSAFDLILEDHECLRCGGYPMGFVNLGGAYKGSFPTYTLTVCLPALGFADALLVVGVPSVSTGFDGIACFNFLNRFTYGNFGDPGQFGLEC